MLFEYLLELILLITQRMMKLCSFSDNNNRFQVLLQEITSIQLQELKTSDINDMIKYFKENHEQIRPEIAFRKLIANIQKHQHRTLWIFQLKNIIILDRLVQDGIFCSQIAQLQLVEIQQLPAYIYFGIKTENFVNLYWKAVQGMARIKSKGNHVLSCKKSHRHSYLKGLKLQQVFQQITILEQFFKLHFTIASQLKYSKPNHKVIPQLSSYALIRYFIIQLAYKSLIYYACELQCFEVIIGQMTKANGQQLLKIKRYGGTFQQNSLELVRYVQTFKGIHGMELFNYLQLNPFQSGLLCMIDDLMLQERETRKQDMQMIKINNSVPLSIQFLPKNKKKVNKSPLYYRLNITEIPQKLPSAFDNWHSSFSEEFPPREIMTLQLIQQIQLQKSKQMKQESGQRIDLRYDLQGDYIINEGNRQRLAMNGSVNQIISNYRLVERTNEDEDEGKIIQRLQFDNIYSDLDAGWNT